MRIKWKVIEFKSSPYYWELTRDGKKKFDVRLVDHQDTRFRALEVWKPYWPTWLIKLTNTETGEALYYKLLALKRMPGPSECINIPFTNWIILYFGDQIKEE